MGRKLLILLRYPLGTFITSRKAENTAEDPFQSDSSTSDTLPTATQDPVGERSSED